MTSPLADALRDRYVLERELGRGGMATVYLARDLRHDRLVALKVILPELGVVLGPERFLSEIRVTAHLQHPNLLPLFDSGEAAGLLYYTMPYVEGESLRQRLSRDRQLPINDAVRMAVAIAGALDYAHRQGVLHRDLKPENILLADGQPVVADFGIALAVSKAGGTRVTQTGLSLGTPQYMSPEQAAGDRTLDPRTDVYSLGVVLYEMLTGDPPHTGSTVQAVIAKVLTEKPRPMRSVRETIPEHVDAAVGCALAKLPADRWVTASQFASALQDGSSNPALARLHRDSTATVPLGSRPARSNRLRALLPWALLGVVGVTLAAREWDRRSSLPREPVRFALAIPESQRLVEFQWAPIAISPDGRAVAYVGRAGGGSMLYVRPIGELQARPLRGTENAQTPFFSSDGRWIAFIVPGRDKSITLKKVPAQGGSVMTVAEVPVQGLGSRLGPGIVGAGGAWSANGIILVGSERGLFRIPATGGTAERVTVVDTVKGEAMHGWPLFLPDGQSVVFGVVEQVRFSNSMKYRLALTSLDGTAHTTLVEPGATPAGIVGDLLIFGPGDGTLAAVPIDLRRRRLTAEPVTLVDSVRTGSVSLSKNGSLIYVRGSNLSQLALVDTRGNQVGGSDAWRQYDFPRISPDGRRIAAGIGGSAGSDVWVYDLASKALSRLTTGGAARPEWTPDGRRIAYLTTGSARWEAWWTPADGSGPAERLYRSPSSRISEITFAAGGDLAVLRVDDPRTARDIVLLPLTGNTSARSTTPLAATTANEIQPRVSPDGRLIAYVSDETGELEVYVRPFPRAGGRAQVSSGGGSEPAWSVDGKRLFYRAGGRFVAATLAPPPRLDVVSREELFDDRYRMGLFRSRFDVHPNGKHFVVLRPAAQSQEVVVVLDWVAELRSRTSAVRSTPPLE